jgi:hypothetical protein
VEFPYKVADIKEVAVDTSSVNEGALAVGVVVESWHHALSPHLAGDNCSATPAYLLCYVMCNLMMEFGV